MFYLKVYIIDVSKQLDGYMWTNNLNLGVNGNFYILNQKYWISSIDVLTYERAQIEVQQV